VQQLTFLSPPGIAVFPLFIPMPEMNGTNPVNVASGSLEDVDVAVFNKLGESGFIGFAPFFCWQIGHC
jgi:hypothetical protein